MRLRSVLALSLLALPLLPSGPAARAEGGPPPAAVRVEKVVAERIRDHRRVTGEVRAIRRAAVAAREGAIVLELSVREGAAVKGGQPLARLDGERLRIEVARMEAEEAQAAAVLEERRADLERTQRDADAVAALASRDAARPKERDDAASAARVAAARVAAAERSIEVLRRSRALAVKRLADTEVKAPWSGTVTKLRTEVGAWVGEGDPVLELVSSSELEVRLEVPQRSMGPLRSLGGALRVVVEADGSERDLAGWRIVGDVDPVSRNFTVLVPLTDPAGCAPGMSVTAWVPTGEENEHLLVSRDAILRGAMGTFVYVATPGGEGKPASAGVVPVEVEFSLGDRAAVRSPMLSAGALVVVEGNERLFPGAPVIPREGKSPGENR